MADDQKGEPKNIAKTLLEKKGVANKKYFDSADWEVMKQKEKQTETKTR